MDYLITGVRFNSAETKIAYYAVRSVEEDRAGDASLWTLEQVALAIFSGSTFMTARWSPIFNKWMRGAVVEVLLRSRSDSTTADNLENLPRV